MEIWSKERVRENNDTRGLLLSNKQMAWVPRIRTGLTTMGSHFQELLAEWVSQTQNTGGTLTENCGIFDIQKRCDNSGWEKKTTSPHFMLLTNYTSFSMQESIISIYMHAVIVAHQLTWTFFRRKKAPLSSSPIGLVCFERDSRRKWQSLDHKSSIWSKVTVTVSTIGQCFL